MSIKIWAAFGEAHLALSSSFQKTPKKTKIKASSSSSSASAKLSAGVHSKIENKARDPLSIPHASSWAIFPTGSSYDVVSPSTTDQLRIPDEDFCAMPRDLKTLLFPFVVDSTRGDLRTTLTASAYRPTACRASNCV